MLDELDDFDRHGVGGNSPPDAYALRVDEVATLTKTTSEWLNKVSVIEDQDQADQLANYITQLRAKKAEIEVDAKTETKPLYDAYVACREKWKEPYTTMDRLIEMVRPLGTAWLKKLKDEQEAIARKAREEAEEAERVARKAREDAARAAKEAEEGEREKSRANTAATILNAERLEEEAAEKRRAAEDAEKAKPSMGGGTINGRGKTMSMRKGANVFTIIDRKKAIGYLVSKFDEECLDDAIIKAAKRHEAAWKGKDIPGISVTEGEAKAV